MTEFEKLMSQFQLPAPPEVVCDAFMDHETWFGLMRLYDLDWPCPSCKASL